MITLKSGDDFTSQFTAKQGAAAYDLTGCTLTAQLRAWPDGPVVKTVTIVVTSAASGIGSLSFSLTGVAPGQYGFDVKLVDASSKVHHSDSVQINVIPAFTP